MLAGTRYASTGWHTVCGSGMCRIRLPYLATATKYGMRVRGVAYPHTISGHRYNTVCSMRVRNGAYPHTISGYRLNTGCSMRVRNGGAPEAASEVDAVEVREGLVGHHRVDLRRVPETKLRYQTLEPDTKRWNQMPEVPNVRIDYQKPGRLDQEGGGGRDWKRGERREDGEEGSSLYHEEDDDDGSGMIIRDLSTGHRSRGMMIRAASTEFASDRYAPRQDPSHARYRRTPGQYTPKSKTRNRIFSTICTRNVVSCI
eukprot:33762-Rhodomonas_salina.1